MTIRSALTSAGAAVLGCLLLAPVALAANGESTPLNLPAGDSAGNAGAGAAGSSVGGGGLVRTIVGLAVVLGVIYGLHWVLKQVKASKEERSSGQGLAPLATLSLGPNRSLQLVRTGSEIVLLGVGEGGVTPIRTYTEAEARKLGLLSDENEDRMGPPAAGTGLAGLGPASRRPALRNVFARGIEDLRRKTVIDK
jgi:flagellar protein FliO/FliZ